MRLALLLLLAACRTPPIDLPLPDAGAADLLPPAQCTVLSGMLQQILSTQTSCNSDGDCAAVVTRCGLPGNCGAAIEEGALLQIGQIVSAWDSYMCGANIHCSPCGGGGPGTNAHCRNHVCTLIQTCAEIQSSASMILSAPQPCTGDADCSAVGPVCGLTCTVYLNEMNLMTVTPLLDAWNGQGCDQVGCLPCPPGRKPKCAAGMCAPE
jgi:hypothetical protein